MAVCDVKWIKSWIVRCHRSQLPHVVTNTPLKRWQVRVSHRAHCQHSINAIKLVGEFALMRATPIQIAEPRHSLYCYPRAGDWPGLAFYLTHIYNISFIWALGADMDTLPLMLGMLRQSTRWIVLDTWSGRCTWRARGNSKFAFILCWSIPRSSYTHFRTHPCLYLSDKKCPLKYIQSNISSIGFSKNPTYLNDSKTGAFSRPSSLTGFLNT